MGVVEMTNHEQDVRARVEFGKWLEGKPERRNTPEEQNSINNAIALDAGNADARALFTQWAESAFEQEELPASHPANTNTREKE